MSSNGTRKSTKGWETGPSGEAFGSNNIVVIDEPTVPAMAAMNEAARAEAVRAEASRTEAAKTEVSAPSGEAARPRRSTLETFNEELAVLERPLEGDVEYIDEKPPRRWPRQLGMFVGAVALVGLGGVLVMSRHKMSVAPVEPLPAVALAAAPAPAPIAEAQPAAALIATAPGAPAAQAPAAAPAETDDDAADADDQEAASGAEWKAPSRTEWTKTRTHTKVTTSKHARSGGGKVVYRRTVTTTVKHHHVVKRTVSGRRER